jgi:uncharacterized protein with GYD domain
LVWLRAIDGYAILEAPDNVSLAGTVLAITAGGTLASVETMVLMTVEENARGTRRRVRALATVARESRQRT